MNNVSKLRLSLRKLFVVTLAAGPLAVLPSPVWAVLPTNSSFNVTAGTASAATGSSGNIVTITASDRAVLVWGNNTTQLAALATEAGAGGGGSATLTVTNFFVGTGQTYNFALPPGGSVLNRVKAGNATTAAGALTDALSGVGQGAVINGSLVSDGKVYILADSGSITVNSGAVLNTSGGLVLSTLPEASDGIYLTTGNLSFANTTTDKNVTIIGTALSPVTATGAVSSYSSSSTVGVLSATSDVLLQSVTAGQAMTLGSITTGGNLSVTSNNGAITQAPGSRISVGFGVTGNQTASFNTGSTVVSTATPARVITLDKDNDFETLSFSTNGAVTIVDVSTIVLGASTTPDNLNVTVNGLANANGINQVSGNAILTNGAVSVGGNADFTSNAYRANITIANGASVGGTLTISTANAAISYTGTGNSTTGNLQVGAIKSDNNPVNDIVLALGSGNVAVDAGTGLPTGVVTNYPTPGSFRPINPATATGVDPDGNANAALPTVSFYSSNAMLGGAGDAGTASPQFLKTTSTAPLSAFNPEVTGALATNPVTQTHALTPNAAGTNPTISQTAGQQATLATATAPSTALVKFSGVQANLQKNGGNVTINGGSSNVTVAGAIVAGDQAGTTTASRPNVSVTGANVTFAALGSLSTTGNATVNATAGNAVLRGVTGNLVSLTATGGNITQAAGTISTISATTSSASATGRVVLDGANTFFAGTQLNVTSGPGASVVNNTNLAVILGNTTSTGDLEINAGTGAITLGSGAGSVATPISVTGNLTLKSAPGVAGTAISDNPYSTVSVGGLFLDTGANGDVSLTAATSLGALSPRVSYGSVNTVALGQVRNLSYAETASANLGNITAATVSVTSATGGINDSGNVSAASLTLSAANGQNITLDSSNHNVTALVLANATGNTSFLSNRTAGVTVSATSNVSNLTLATANPAVEQAVNIGTMNAGNLTVNASGVITISGVANVTGNASLTSTANVAAAITDAVAAGTGLTVGNVTTLSATGNTVTSGGISFNRASRHDFNSVVLNGVAGATNIQDINNVTISGNATGLVTVSAGNGTTVNNWNLVFGNLNVSGTTGGGITAVARSATGTTGDGTNSGTITQLPGTFINSYGDVSFTTTNNSITLNNTGNNFGGVTASLGSGNNTAASIAIREAGTMRLKAITSNRSNVTLTSDTGSIIEATVAAHVSTNYRVTNATLTLNATSGSIALGNQGGLTSGNSTNITATAPTGAVQLFSNNTEANMILRNVTANSLAVTYSGNQSITQASGTSLRVFGTSNFTSSNTSTTGSAGSINVSSTTNNFGRVNLSTASTAANITIVEDGTLNLGSVTMPASSTGSFSATSVNGSIIDTGLIGVRPGGTAGNTPAVGSGLITLTASNGDIVLDDPTTDFPTTGGIVFNARNVTLAPLGTVATYLGGSSASSTGNLTVNSATGAILQAGAITATGDAVFTTGNQPITLTNAANNFGTVRFTGSVVKITEASDMAIVTGSAATGLSEFVSTGNISIVNRGGIVGLGSNAAATSLMSATGSIILPRLIQATGTLTVFAAGTKDLSALSVVNDLGGRTPTNLGAGTYVAPSP